MLTLLEIPVEVLSSSPALITFSTCLLMHTGLVFVVLIQLNVLHFYVLQTSKTEVMDASVLPATMYKRYLKKYNKEYDSRDVRRRFELFKESLNEISRLNQETGAIHGLTKLSDLAKGEIFPPLRPSLRSCEEKNKPCVRNQPPINCEDFHLDEVIPDKFDWRDRGVIGPVLDQKQCNGCWAFGIVGVMESMAAIHDIEHGVRRSIQELIDCSEFTDGCTNGHVTRGLDWLCFDKWGVVTEDQYPLKLVTNNCTLYKDEIPEDAPKIKHYCQLCDMNEENILRLVYFHGPVMIVVNAEPWRSYMGGVIQMSCFRSRDGLTHDHVVQVVGYDRSGDADVPHYIVRNSWGEDFGDGGYVKLEIGKNICGVADEVSFFDIYKEPSWN